MTSFWKNTFWLSVLVVGYLSFSPWSNAEKMLVEPSIAGKKVDSAQGDLVDLFKSLGMTPPSHGFANPCYDLEESAVKYCTKRDVIKILEKKPLSKETMKFFIEVVKSKNPCQLVGEYIGRVCQTQNFNKIIDHFVLED